MTEKHLPKPLGSGPTGYEIQCCGPTRHHYSLTRRVLALLLGVELPIPPCEFDRLSQRQREQDEAQESGR